jgi:tRNA-Thr(GGU) m(6)t(6)A37 methyltransferase TsaA
MTFQIHPIGLIHNKNDDVRLEIYPEYQDGLLGIEQFSHILVIYWLHENDRPEERGILQVHPRHNKSNPLTGVFATHAPVRPNLIALTRCRLLEVIGNILKIDQIDAYDGSPVIDIKAFFPDEEPLHDCRFPDWKGKAKQKR